MTPESVYCVTNYLNIRFEFLFKPHTGVQVQMVGGLVEEQEMRFDVESPGEGDTHPPAPAEVFRLLLLHLASEAQAVQDGGGPGLGRIGAHLVQPLVDVHQLLLCVVILRGHQLLGHLLQADPLLVHLHHALQRRFVGGGHFTR